MATVTSIVQIFIANCENYDFFQILFIIFGALCALCCFISFYDINGCMHKVEKLYFEKTFTILCFYGNSFHFRKLNKYFLVKLKVKKVNQNTCFFIMNSC